MSPAKPTTILGVLVRDAVPISEGKTAKGGTWHMLGIRDGPVTFCYDPADYDVVPEGVVFRTSKWDKQKWSVNKVACPPPQGEEYRGGTLPAQGKSGVEHFSVTTETFPKTETTLQRFNRRLDEIVTAGGWTDEEVTLFLEQRMGKIPRPPPVAHVTPAVSPLLYVRFNDGYEEDTEFHVGKPCMGIHGSKVMCTRLDRAPDDHVIASWDDGQWDDISPHAIVRKGGKEEPEAGP
jgi:hypothetical protein